MSVIASRSGVTPLLFSSPSSLLTVSANPLSRLDNKVFTSSVKCVNGIGPYAPLMVKERCSMVIRKAATEENGPGSETLEASSESDDEDAELENLALESKLQLKLEHKMKMKFAKNIRLRRKKLVRKRRLRKKGSWPPSKLNKNKNV